MLVCRPILLLGVALTLGSWGLGVSGCRCAEEPNASTEPAPLVVASGPQCAVRPGQFNVSPADARPAATEDLAEVELPFAVELGSAIAHPGGFAVTALRATQQGSEAVLALLPSDLKAGRSVALGPVHGAVAPPKLAANGAQFIAVVPEGDASGQSLRLATVHPDAPEGAVVWGDSVHEGDDESQAFDVALLGEQGVLVWDDWDKSKNHGVVRLARFSSSKKLTLSAPVAVSAPDIDAESPRVVTTSGGFWLAWVVNDEAPTLQLVEALRKKPSAPAPSASQDDAPDQERTLGALKRGIELVRLDSQGVPVGNARRITPPGAQVTQFDLASDGRGNAHVAWRAGASTLASEGGELGVLTVSADGNERRVPLGEVESGAGVPLLLFDPALLEPPLREPTLATGWLAVTNPGDDTQLFALAAEPPSALRALDQALASALPVAVKGSEILLVRALGRELVFTVAACR